MTLMEELVLTVGESLLLIMLRIVDILIMKSRSVHAGSNPVVAR